MDIHIPPKYDQYGNHQWWFLELEDSDSDEIINGVLHGLVPLSPLLLLWILV